MDRLIKYWLAIGFCAGMIVGIFFEKLFGWITIEMILDWFN